LLVVDRTALVDRLANHVQDAAERLWADRHGDRPPGINGLFAAHQAVGRIHGDGAHFGLTQVLGHFQHQLAAAGVHMQRIQDVGQIGIEVHVDDCARDLSDRADVVGGHDEYLSFLSQSARPRGRRHRR
jgi:hypothetical protein